MAEVLSNSAGTVLKLIKMAHVQYNTSTSLPSFQIENTAKKLILSLEIASESFIY